MNCPYCNYQKSRVVDTESELEREIARCRICLMCNRPFTTTETVDREIYALAAVVSGRECVA